MFRHAVIGLNFITKVWSDCADAPHVTVPIQNVELSNGQAMRGISVGAGTPRQNFSMLALPYFNDTWIYNSSTTLCDWSTSDGCVSYRGGLYDVQSSSTSSSAADVYAAGGDPRDEQPIIIQDSPFSAWVNDDLLVEDTTLEGFPIGMPGTSLYPGYDNQNNLGMGPNSTILNALLAAKKIASRSFSFWWGLQGATPGAQMDGHIVFGGYDAAKVLAPNITMAMTPPSLACHSSMFVMISDVSLGFPNGTKASLTSPNSIVACILPHYPAMLYFPETPYYDRFEAYSGTTNVGRGGGNGIQSGMLYGPDDVYQGDVIVTLDNGFQATIPNELLIVPPLDVRDSGAAFTNTTVREVLISPTEGSNSHDWAILGKPFFQSVYLTADYDSKTFTLSQVNATTDTNIVALGQDCPSPQLNVPAGGSANKTASTHSPPDADSLSTGTIAGIVVGSVLGATVIVGLTVFWLFRRRKSCKAAEKHKESLGSYGANELDQHRRSAQIPHYAQEMLSRPDPGELNAETRPLELPNESAAAVRQKRLLEGLNSPVELA